jgi:hypothetical protein
MADIDQAIQFVISLEDDHRYPGCITQLRGDSGGRTRVGIAARFHAELAAKGFYEGDPIIGSLNPLRWTPTTVSYDAAAPLILSTYQDEYATPLRLSEFHCQDLANRLLGFAVNEGRKQAVVCLQRCLPGLTADGAIGPATIAAANVADGKTLIVRMKAEQVNFYAHIAAVNPALAGYANGLKDRANA